MTNAVMMLLHFNQLVFVRTMSQTVQLVLRNEVLPGFQTEAVISGLARLLKVSEEQAHKLFHGGETVIKRELPVSEAERYLEVLAKVGAVVQAKPLDAPAIAIPLAEPVAAKPVHSDSSFPSLLVTEEELAPAAPWKANPPTPAAESNKLSYAERVAAMQQEQTSSGTEALSMQPADAAATDIWAELDQAEQQQAAQPAMEMPEELISCPSCGLRQSKRTLCRQCGADMPRMLAAQRDMIAAPKVEISSADSSSRRAGYDQPSSSDVPRLFGFSMLGRLDRLRYMAYCMVYSVLAMPLFIVAAVVIALSPKLGGLMIVLAGLALTISMVRLMVLRMHDFAVSGKWLFLFPISALMMLTGSPKAGMVVLGICSVASVLLLLIPGHGGDNGYGEANEAAPPWVKAGAALYILFLLGSVLQMMTGDWQQKLMQKAMQARPAAEQNQSEQGEQAHSDDAGMSELDRQAAKVVDEAAAQRGVTLSAEQRAQMIEAVRQQMQAAGVSSFESNEEE